MTYQAASGAGAQNMRELISQMRVINEFSRAQELANPKRVPFSDIDKRVADTMRCESFPTDKLLALPLAGSLIPWIDVKRDNGQSKEEWKAGVEANKDSLRLPRFSSAPV